jgi:hypothetical protein
MKVQINQWGVYAFAKPKPKTRGIGVAMELFPFPSPIPSPAHKLFCLGRFVGQAKIPYSRAYEIFWKSTLLIYSLAFPPNFRRWDPNNELLPRIQIQISSFI